MSNFLNLSSEKKSYKHCYVQVKSRTFFVRHGLSEEEDGAIKKGLQTTGSSKISQKPEAKLSQKGHSQIQEATQYIKSAGIRSDEIKLWYSDDTTRSKESVSGMVGGILDGETHSAVFGQINRALKTSNKDLEDIESRKGGFGELLTETGNFIKELRQNTKVNVTDVLVGHQTNKALIENITKAEPGNQIFNFEIEPGEVREYDIDVDGNWVNVDRHPETLFLVQKNIKQILDDLVIIPEFNEKVVLYKKNPHSREKYRIWQLQNDINQLFQEYPQYFETLLGSDNSDLRTFCLTNLLLRGNTKTILVQYEKTTEKLSEKEKKVLVGFSQDKKQEIIENVKRIFTRLFVGKKVLWEEKTDRNLSEDPGFKSWYDEISQKREIFEKAKEIQKYSLDETIRSDTSIESESILDLRLYEIKKKTKEIKDEQGNMRKIDVVERENGISIDDIIKTLLTPESRDGFVLPAIVGQGKTMWMTKLAKKLATSVTNQKILFKTAREISATITEPEDIQKTLESYGLQKGDILLIDALDEVMDNDVRKALHGFVCSEHPFKMVITARPSDFFLLENGAEYKSNGLLRTIGMNPISKEEFIQSRISDKENQKNILEILKIHNLAYEIEGNPLLLSFVCKLATEVNRNWKDLKIKPLSEIQNKAGIYESVARLVLAVHPENKRETTVDDVVENDKLELDLDKLGKFAYAIFSKQPFEGKISRKLSLLCKKVGENQYEFIHYSFYEYFLARHLALSSEMSKSAELKDEKTKELLYPGFTRGEEMIFQIRDSYSLSLKWYEIEKFISFYNELLLNRIIECKKTGNEIDLKRYIDQIKYFFGEMGLYRDLSKRDFFGMDVFFFSALATIFFVGIQIPNTNLSEFIQLIHLYEGKMKFLDNSHVIKCMVESAKEFSKKVRHSCGEVILNLYVEKFKNIINNDRLFYYEYLAGIQCTGALEMVKKGINTMIENRDHYYLTQILKELVNLNTPETLDYVRNIFIKHGEFISGGYWWNMMIFDQLFSSMSQAELVSILDRCIYNGNYHSVTLICLTLINAEVTWGKTVVNKYADILMDARKYELATEVYRAFIRSDGHDIVDIDKVIDRLFVAGWMDCLESIYAEILKPTILEIISNIKSGKNEEKNITILCQGISKLSTPVIMASLQNTKVNRQYSATIVNKIYDKLSNYTITMQEKEGDDYLLFVECVNIAKCASPEVILFLKDGIGDVLSQKNHIQELNKYLEELAYISSGEINFAKDMVNKCFVNADFEGVSRICQELMRCDLPEIIEYIKGVADKLMNIKEYTFARNIYVSVQNLND